MPTDYDDWRKIEETETARARPGSPREKFVRRSSDWLRDARPLIGAVALARTPPSI